MRKWSLKNISDEQDTWERMMYNLGICLAYTNKYVMVVANTLQHQYKMATQLLLVAKKAKSHGCHSE